VVMSVVVGGGVVMIGGEWLWSWWVAVVVVRGGEGADGVGVVIGGGVVVGVWGSCQGVG
jgi:hypothetical protein